MPSVDTLRDRKRPAIDEGYHSEPPQKRQIVKMNGTSVGGIPDEFPGKEDLERYQKDAILRQMREYKREASTLESHIASIKEKTQFHDEHLRLVDIWFSQLLDDVVLSTNSMPEVSQNVPFESSLLTSQPDLFERHLSDRSSQIKAAISTIFSRARDAPQEVRQLQQRLAQALKAEKAHAVELQKYLSEKERMSELLESASVRYILAEKKLDRARSAQVAKMEAVAQGSNVKPDPDAMDVDRTSTPTGETNGVSVDTAALAAAETARAEASALADKRKEQLDQLVQDNKKLIEQVTATQLKMGALSEEDVAKSELFKALKTQHEDVVKRFNDVEAGNIKLREENKDLQSERTAYRDAADTESRTAMLENEQQLARAETDLARVRHARDELLADLQKAKAQIVQETVSQHQSKELLASQTSRIEALESELERLRQTASDTPMDLGNLSVDELKAKVGSIENEKNVLMVQLKSMEGAWKKAQTAGHKKFQDNLDAEEKIARLGAEKSKAEQKYFGAMKAKELRDQEVRTLKNTMGKSAEIISQLKEAESSCRGLLQNLEKQLAESNNSIQSVTSQQRQAQSDLTEQKSANEKLLTQMEALKKDFRDKDATWIKDATLRREAEIQTERLKIQCEELKKSTESWKKKAQGNQSEEVEMLRAIALCNVCRKNFKNTVIKTCGHVLCSECVEERIKGRSRKCPNCNMPFGINDHFHVTL